ncbi:hypothetical protein E2P81_ATG11623 [Venturia nashicola]|nr:hypothetical protein E2P81_ATG11623 [Venturia nashicola]
MTTTPPSSPPIALTTTHDHIGSQTGNTGQQDAESPGKRRKLTHQGADEEENPGHLLNITFESNNAVMGDDAHENPLEPMLVSGEPVSEESANNSSVDDDEYEFLNLFSDDEDEIHVSTPELQMSSPVLEASSPVSVKVTDSKDAVGAAEPKAPWIYRVDEFPRWNQPRKMTRPMSIDSHDAFQLKPRGRLWESLKQVLFHNRRWWKDRPAPDQNSEYNLVQDASSWLDWDPARELIQDTADRVLDAVPCFKRQAELEGNTRPNALYKTPICIDQERGIRFKLEEMMNLVAGSNDCWLTDSLMETIVHLEAPEKRLREKGRRAWFCTDPMIQTWCAAIDPDIHRSIDDMEEMILEERKISCLPAREMPPDADSIVFFTNRSVTHWKTVHAYVDPNLGPMVSIKNSMGTSHQNGSAINGHKGHDYDSLRRLMICIAKESPNQRFRDTNWAEAWVGNENCPQQYGANDCGVFSAHAAIYLLWNNQVQYLGWYTSSKFRQTQGQVLRLRYTILLKRYLDMTMIARETKTIMAGNARRRWSVSGERTDSGYGL